MLSNCANVKRLTGNRGCGVRR